MFLLVCPVSVIPQEELTNLLSNQSPFLEDQTRPKIAQVTVPSMAPISPEQAQQWSAQYWPTVYRKMNPYGPHPAMVAREEQEMISRPSIPEYMEMAHMAAVEAEESGTGVGVGCVVVERRDDGPDQIVAVAGDARYCGTTCGGEAEPSPDARAHPNIAAHSVMRAIGMIARKRVRMASRAPTPTQDDEDRPIRLKPVTHVDEAPESIASALVDYPLTEAEEDVYRRDNLIPSGYLCVKLEVYLTHEPCLMCSMAIVHSRFARCVFGTKMPKTGGLAADSGLGYGLFWRQELNWRLLCWEYNNRSAIEGAQWNEVVEQELDLDSDTQV